MSEKERPLPEPALGRKGRYEDREGQLMADEIARAAAEGRMEEFLQKEVPDNDYARKLVSMMMGMTGMAPVMDKKDSAEASAPPASGTKSASPPEVPPGVLAAAREGDVRGLMGVLQKEYNSRFPCEGKDSAEQIRTDKPMKPAIERDVIETLIKISADNDVSLDWLTLRALKLYVQEYQRSGRL